MTTKIGAMGAPQLSIIGKLNYGNRELNININLGEIKPITILIGPNLTGKTLTLMCLIRHVSRTNGRVFVRRYTLDRIDDTLKNLKYNVNIGFSFNYGVFVDSYRVSVQPLEGARKEFNEIENIINETIRGEEVPAMKDVKKHIDAIKDLLYEDHTIDDLRQIVSTKDLADAYNAFNEVRNEFGKLIEDIAKEFERASEDYKKRLSHFMPLFIDRSREGWLWHDLELNAEGKNIDYLSSVYAPSLVVLYAVLTYALPGTKILTIEEPEIHAHPSMALFLGYFLARLVVKASNEFYVAASTHSMEFLRGILLGGENITNVYVFDRVGSEITAEKWESTTVIPGFTEPGILSYLAKGKSKSIR